MPVLSTRLPQPLPLPPRGLGVLAIGAGGLGCPALATLVRSGLTRLTLVDDDLVDASNLHRQTLYTEADAGRPKVEVAAERLRALSPHPERITCRMVRGRFTPKSALALAEGHDLILEGADNFATKFLAADAAHLSGLPIVQAGALRFSGWALGSVQGEGACLRCVFEDIPRGQPATCSALGVLGPVVGVLGALEAWLAVELLYGRAAAASQLLSYDGLAGRLRKHRVARRADCALCTGRIRDLDPARYERACAA